MSRIRKAAITAAFTYVHFGLAILTGIVLVPLTLHYLGARSWGLWLATGELLGYAGMTDLGVLGVLPWMIAEADGRADRSAMRRLVGHGVWIGGAIAVAYIAVSALLWGVLPSLLRFTPADRQFVFPPFTLLVMTNAAAHPLRVFRAAISGLQDAWFNGVLSVLQSSLTIAITATLLLKGYGLYALAVAAGVPPIVTFLLCIVRLRSVAPDLMSGWTRPNFAETRHLLTNGTGTWLGSLGWQMLASTNAVVITFLGRPEWVPIYNCTAKLALTATQLVWVPADSALVALAQLHGEQRGAERLRHVVLMMLRLHLLLSGAALCGILAFNPAFVTWWVGPDFFGGIGLSTLLAVGVVVYSLSHGLVTTASVVGQRFKVGLAAVLNGVVQIGLALAFGQLWSLSGIAAAGLLACLATSVPAGIRLLRPASGLSAEHLVKELAGPWLTRAVTFFALAAVAGFFSRRMGLVPSGVLAALISTGYVWYMRPLYVGLPLNARLMEWLVRVRLLPPAVAQNPVLEA